MRNNAIGCGLFLGAVACSSPKSNEDAATQGTGTDSSQEFSGGSAAHPLGGCVLDSAAGEAPVDLYQNTGVLSNDAYPPFSKTLTVRGITLLATADNADEFMRDVATAIEEMLPQDGQGIDRQKQEELIRHMYQRKTVIPLFKGDDNIPFTDAEFELFDVIRDNNSLCDVIFEYGGEGQTMEVVEHILHHVSMVGLHYTFYDDWGASSSSLLYQYMSEAEQRGYYNHNYLSEIPEPEEAKRVAIQEYAYWVITTGWDIQQEFGGGGQEWTLDTLARFEAEQPQMYEVFQRTIPQVLAQPSHAVLAGFED